MAAKAYMSLYNRAYLLAWTAIPFLALSGSEFFCKALQIAQCAMLLDVAHAVLRLTKTRPVAAALYIASRVYLVWIYRAGCPDSVHFTVTALAWSAAEVLRFFYYEFGRARWLRYSAFIVLYPVGVFLGELPLIFYHFAASRFPLDVAALAAYVPGFPYLFAHMLRARARALGAESAGGAKRAREGGEELKAQK